MKKRLLAILLAALMIVSFLPTMAFAANGTSSTILTTNGLLPITENNEESPTWYYIAPDNAWENENGAKAFIGEGKSYQRATINSDATSVYGLILYPDNYTAQTAAISYTSAEWTAMETAGCVFLPAAGYRDDSSFFNSGSNGYYWSANASYNIDKAFLLEFNSSMIEPENYDGGWIGFSVRLVTDVPDAE